MAKPKKVLIVGGGFGGVKAALELADNKNFDVTLLTDRPDFRYYPVIYHAATGGLKSASYIPLAEIFEGKDVKLVIDSAETVDRPGKFIKTTSGKNYSYDILIIAMGVVTTYFGIKGLEDYGYGIKSLEEARKLRDHLHQQLQDDKKPDLNYIVIGGGPTGVELAASLPGYIKHIMKNHGIADRPVHVDLVEAAPRLMPRMPKSYSKALAKRLRKLGVTLYLGQTVQKETGDTLMVNDHPINSHTVIWTAGVTNNPFCKANNFQMSEHSKVIVDRFMQAEPDVYVIGDNADTEFSGMAQTALRDGNFVADNLIRQAKGREMKNYKPKKPVYITPVGNRWAAVLWGSKHFYGLMGWALREAADAAGYKDLEPWWKAAKHFSATMQHEETCIVCSAAAEKS